MLDNELYKQFLEISTRIDDEEISFQNEITFKENDDCEKLIEDHLLRKLSLLCIRISFCCKLIGGEYSVEADRQLKNDIESVKRIFCESRHCNISDNATKNATKQDVLDFLRVVCLENENVLLEYFPDEYALFDVAKDEISDNVYYLVRLIAIFCFTSYVQSYGVSVLENFFNMSAKINPLNKHLQLVNKTLHWISMMYPEIAIRVAEDNEVYFKKCNNDYAGDYYFLYGFAKSKSGDYPTAIKLFEQSYEVNKLLYGEDDWNTARAKKEAASLLFLSTHSEDARKFLISFVDNIENDYYKLPNNFIDDAKLLEGTILYSLLSNSNPMQNPEEYWRQLSLFEKLAYKYDYTNHPVINVRTFKIILGDYYFRIGDYIQAEIAYTDALNTKIQPKIPEIVTDLQIKTELLRTYYAQNDYEMVNAILPGLFSAIVNKELSFEDTCYFLLFVLDLYGESRIELDENRINLFKKIAVNVCTSILNADPDLKDCICDAAGYLCSCTINFSKRNRIARRELEMYIKALEVVDEIVFSSMEVPYQMTLIYTLSLLSWKLDNEKEKTDLYFSRVTKLLESDKVPSSNRGEVLQSVGAYYCRTGNYSLGLCYVNQALQEIENIWKLYIKYLNDDRLIQVLFPIQALFVRCYSTLRQFVDENFAYESVLRFKCLASLAGRERNRALRQSNINSDLMKEIRTLQDEISAFENLGIFRYSDDEIAGARDKAKLRNLEAEFAEQFPNQNQVTEITWEKVKYAIPDECVVLEYFYCILDYGKAMLDFSCETVKTGIDIYITQKRNNESTLNKITIDDGDSVIADATEFVSIIQEKSATPKQKLKLEKLRKCLYDRLVQPIMTYVEDFKTVYIAPDSSLVNLPFEILYSDKQERLGDAHSVIRIECARDFLYSDDATDATKGELIIGNPKYDVHSHEIEGEIQNDSMDEDTRFPDMTYTKQLPFASVEVRRISERSGYPNYTGIFAKKDLILSASGYKSLHIATHGMFDLSQSTNSMYSSYLLFAGVDNWFNTGRFDGLYGDGIVTADEISRLDLNSTELVVLSSCLSGMNDVKICKGFNGMVSAFSAAGVHYVISHLWEAADFSAAVLMDEFYHQYLNNKKSPPEALSIAKEYLRNVTIGDLRRNHWFDDIRKEELDFKTEEAVAKYEKMDDTRKPFRDETYWGGFSCYQCY